MVGPYPKAHKVAAVRHRCDRALSRMHRQANGTKPGFDHFKPVPKLLFVIVQKHEVIHIADIAPAPEFLLDPVIKAVQIHICEELAGEVSDGNAPASLAAAPVVGVHDLSQQFKQAPVAYEVAKLGQQDVMPDVLKVPADVALQHVGRPPAELRVAVCSPVRPFAQAACECVVYEPPLPQRLDHLAHGVAPEDRADAYAIGEALLRAGLLGEKPSTGQRHVFLRREALPRIHSLIERAESEFDEREAEKLQRKLLKNQFTLEDFLDQLHKVKRMGSIGQILDMLPGMGRLRQQVDIDNEQAQRQLKKVEAIIYSMTPAERRNPKLLNASRKRRVAEGSGTSVQDVNSLLKQFREMQRLMRMLGKGQMPRIPGMFR